MKTIVATQTLTSRGAERRSCDGRDRPTTSSIRIAFRSRSKTPSGTMVQAYDGTHAWMKDPRGVHDVPEPLVARARGERCGATSIALLLAAKSGQADARGCCPTSRTTDGQLTPRARALGDRPRPDRALHRSASRPDHQADLRRRRAGPAAGRGGVLRLSRRSTASRSPFRADRGRSGRCRSSGASTDVKINTPLDPALFKRPAS